MMKKSRILNTVRYMTPRQWKYRIYYSVRNKLKKRKAVNANHEIVPALLKTYYSADVGNADALSVADGICEGRIPAISGIVVSYTGDWDLKTEDYRLVSFRLNSFRWLLDLSDAYKVTGDRRYVKKGFEYIKDWQDKCGIRISGDKWNPYVIAERITNWIGFVSEYGNERQIKEVAKWIYPQAQELKDSIEYQLGANHLLSEAKALIYAGAFLKNDVLYETGKSILLSERCEQFYPDGGHYEQSVSYHVESLQQYFESYVIIKQSGDTDAEKRFVPVMREPYRFLNGMIGVNGKIPLFNDAAFDYPFFDAADFLYTASCIYQTSPPKGQNGNYSKRWAWLGIGTAVINWETKIKYDNTGFVHYPMVIAGKRYSFYMDCGNNGPDYNPGHTHADALSVLLYSEDKEILVDSGVFTYKTGTDRNACRATKAHNTVEVDERDSAEVWSSFRVARRGHSDVIYFDSDKGLRIKAVQDGYKKNLKDPVIHTRAVKIIDNRISIIDRLECKGRHHAVSRFHVSPDCVVSQIDSRTCVIDGSIVVLSERQIKVVDCKIAGLFGKPEDAKCIEIDFQGEKSVKTMFSLT